MSRPRKSNENIYLNQSPVEFKITSNEEILFLNYLYLLFEKKIKSPRIKVVEFLGIANVSIPSPKSPTVFFSEDVQNYLFSDQVLLLTVIHDNQAFKVTFSRIEESYEHYINVKHFVFINAMSSESLKTDKFFNFIRNEAIKNSSFNQKTILYSFHKSSFINSLKILDIPEVSLDSIYIPESKIKQIKRFISTIENYESNKTNLRYLLNGVPGTGKTKIIHAIVSALKNKATIVIVNSDFVPVKMLLEFCSIFEKSLLIIDDIDFITANREFNNDRGMLNVFLQTLDGFVPDHVFLIGSTNDKKLIDSAASRPGRFDMILDINEINPSNYLSLVRRETDDEQIISFFDQIILDELKAKKVTGAYIVNLVKQLINSKSIKKEINQNDFYDFLSLSHKGFYSNNTKEYDIAVGFNN